MHLFNYFSYISLNTASVLFSFIQVFFRISELMEPVKRKIDDSGDTHSKKPKM